MGRPQLDRKRLRSPRRFRVTSSDRSDHLIGASMQHLACWSIEAHHLSHDTGHLCQKSGVSDRHGRSLRAGQSFNLGTELLRERLDDARAEPGFWLSKDAVRLANPIVSDRKLPIRSIDIICNGYPTIDFINRKGMLHSIYDKFGGDQAEALGLTGSLTAAFASHFDRDWPVSRQSSKSRGSRTALRDKAPF